MIKHSVEMMVGVIAASVCLPVHAQDLAGLTRKLRGMPGKDPICISVRVEASTATKDGQETANPKTTLDVRIESDANSFALAVPGRVPYNRLGREFSLLRASELTHYGPSLANELAGMELIDTRDDSLESVPCTRWHLQAEETRAQSGARAIVRKDVKLWIDADGYPMAASFKKQGESRLLLIKMTRKSSREQRYTRHGDRLVLVMDKTDEAEDRGKSKGARRVVTTTVEIAGQRR